MFSRRALVVTALAGVALAGSAFAADSVGPFRAGVHYRLVPHPHAPSVAKGKVEVAEAFWYGCGHCFALDPVLEDWNSKKAAFVEFVRVPVIWGPVHRQHAKLYYTLQALRRPELHAKVFAAIHTQGQTLADRDEVKGRAAQAGFLAGFGITQQQFDAAYDSMSVATNMQRAEEFTRELNVDNVPTLFVNGKYATSVGEAGGEPQLVQLLNRLADSERQKK